MVCCFLLGKLKTKSHKKLIINLFTHKCAWGISVALEMAHSWKASTNKGRKCVLYLFLFGLSVSPSR